jgi:hypothetical protein
MWRVDDAAAAGVDGHMGDAGVEEDQVAELQIGPGYRLPRCTAVRTNAAG